MEFEASKSPDDHLRTINENLNIEDILQAFTKEQIGKVRRLKECYKNNEVCKKTEVQRFKSNSEIDWDIKFCITDQIQKSTEL